MENQLHTWHTGANHTKKLYGKPMKDGANAPSLCYNEKWRWNAVRNINIELPENVRSIITALQSHGQHPQCQKRPKRFLKKHLIRE